MLLLLAGLTAASAQAGISSRSPIWLHRWTPADADSFYGGRMARAGTGDLYVAGELRHAAANS